MSDIVNPYSNFNNDQIIPVLSDINLAKTIVSNITASLTDYIESIYDIHNSLQESGAITDELKNTMDKNVAAILIEVSTAVNQSISFKNVGTKKEKLFERLKRGTTYKYKLANGAIVENPELVKIDAVKVDTVHRTIEIGSEIFQFSDASDYVPTSSDMSNFLQTTQNLTVSPEEEVAAVLARLQAEVAKIYTIQAYLDMILYSVTYVINTITTDVHHFKLFDPKVLDSMDL